MGTLRKGLSVPFLFLTLSLGLITAGCAGDRSPVRTDNVEEIPMRGELAGSVTIGRRYGAPEIPGETPYPPPPAPGLELFISTLSGQKVGSAVTGSDGTYSILLPPGTYHVDMTPLSISPPAKQYTDQLPATVIITEWQETRLDILVMLY